MHNLLEQFKKRRILLLEDDSLEQSRAVLVSPAALVDRWLMNELISLSSGLCYVALSSERVSAFMLDPMARPDSRILSPASSSNPTQFMHACVSVEAREGISTGISADDRATTVRILADDPPQPRKLVKPGHIFPVEVRTGGVLVKHALPEGALDLVIIAGYSSAALFMDLLDQKGELMSGANLHALAEKHQIPFFSLSELVRFRLKNEKFVHRVAEARLPTSAAGELRSVVYRSTIHTGEHVALIKGELTADQVTVVRVQPEFTFSDVFGGDSPASRQQIQNSLAEIGRSGRGVFIYLRRPSIGQLGEQIRRAPNHVERGSPVMMRDYGLGAQILRDLGVGKIEILTTGKKELFGLDVFGIEIVGQRPIPKLVLGS